MTSTPSARAISQNATTTDNLTARIALHAFGTNPLDWYSWLGQRLPLDGEVLEAGAGTGALWKRVEHFAPGLNLTLTDFSSAMCTQLRAIPGAVVVQCDATCDSPGTRLMIDFAWTSIAKASSVPASIGTGSGNFNPALPPPRSTGSGRSSGNSATRSTPTRCSSQRMTQFEHSFDQVSSHAPTSHPIKWFSDQHGLIGHECLEF